MRKQRPPVPAELVEQVLFDSDLLCCVCQRRGHHIHHIDADPTNNDLSNLVLLCFDHHHEVSVKGGLARRLSAGVLRRYRDEWYRRVKSRREYPRPVETELDRSLFRAALDAAAFFEVKRLRFRLGLAEWDEIGSILSDLVVFIEPDAVRARREVLYCLQDIADQARHGMTREVARRVLQLVDDCIDMPGLATPSGGEFGENEKEMFAIALAIGNALVHDGDKYLRDLRIVDHGAELMWKILRYARVNALSDLEQRAVEMFEWTGRNRTKDAGRLLAYYREHARPEQRGIPDLPDDLEEKLSEKAVEAV